MPILFEEAMDVAKRKSRYYKCRVVVISQWTLSVTSILMIQWVSLPCKVKNINNKHNRLVLYEDKIGTEGSFVYI